MVERTQPKSKWETLSVEDKVECLKSFLERMYPHEHIGEEEPASVMTETSPSEPTTKRRR